jgi:hypothetical protein
MNSMPCVSLFIELYVITFAIDAPHSCGVRDININKLREMLGELNLLLT